MGERAGHSMNPLRPFIRFRKFSSKKHLSSRSYHRVQKWFSYLVNLNTSPVFVYEIWSYNQYSSNQSTYMLDMFFINTMMILIWPISRVMVVNGLVPYFIFIWYIISIGNCFQQDLPLLKMDHNKRTQSRCDFTFFKL